MEKKGSDKSQKRSTKKAKSTTVNAVKPEKVVISEQKEKTKQQEELTQSVAVSEEKPHRPPQFITENLQEVTHGRVFQSKLNPEHWYFTAKIDGMQLRPRLMRPEDVAAASEIGRNEWPKMVESLMKKYFPTKLLPQKTAEQLENDTVLEDGREINKFNVFKESREDRPDFGKYKFYAQVGNEKFSCVAMQNDLDAYFDRVATPQELVSKVFGEQLHLASHYKQFNAPPEVTKDNVRITKPRGANKWQIHVDMGGRGKTDVRELAYHDGVSYFETKTASRVQLAAKYFGTELSELVRHPAAKQEPVKGIQL